MDTKTIHFFVFDKNNTYYYKVNLRLKRILRRRR